MTFNQALLIFSAVAGATAIYVACRMAGKGILNSAAHAALIEASLLFGLLAV